MRSGATGRLARLGGGAETAVAERVPLLAGAMVLVFLVFFVRLFQLQVIESADLRERSQRNSVRTIYLEAPRGEIVDREGRALATTRPAFGLSVMPVDLRRPELTFAALGQLIDADPDALRSQVGERRGRERFQAIRLAADLSEDGRARVESHLFALPGVLTDALPRRHYVEGDLAAHLLGALGEVRREQLATREYADYRSGEVVGQSGLESLMQAQLRGRAGGRNLVVDVAGRVIEVLDEVRPTAGGRVVLTLDLDLQRAAEQAFLPDVLGGPPRMGALVALDPRNGDVLALVSKPSYDPNAFAGGVDPETWKRLTRDPHKPLQHRALAGQYPPGSTYKALVAAAALEEGVIHPAHKVYCPGSFTLGRRSYRCWKKEGHGEVDLRRALIESCDVYFYRAGLALGVDRLAFFARGFGLGKRSGIPLSGEAAGLVPTSAWKQNRFREKWMLGETVSVSIGQGFDLVTPLQLAVAYGAIATGNVMTPRLVQGTTDEEGNPVPGPAPHVRGTAPVSPAHLERVRAALEGVVGEPRGTGGRSRVPGVRVAGKTGTAQVVGLQHTEGIDEAEIELRHRDHAWFAAFAPVEAPEIVVAVLVEHGGHGGSAAAPIAQKVLARYFEKKNPPAPEAAPPLDARAAEAPVALALQIAAPVEEDLAGD
jgi:penicillin-binding protein 2